MIKEISKFIADESGFVLGDTLQATHRTDDSPDRCSVVLESVGAGIYYDLPDKLDKMIQVISRAETYIDAGDDALVIFNALCGSVVAGSGIPLGTREILAVAPATQDYLAMTIEALADPQYTGQDEKGRYEFSTNYIFRIQNK